MIILHLNLKTAWFDLILGQIKKEEYRDISDHWRKVFHENTVKIKGIYYKPEDITICFSNGYSKLRRQMFIPLLGVSIGYGVKLWGAPNEKVFILKLGEIIEMRNVI